MPKGGLEKAGIPIEPLARRRRISLEKSMAIPTGAPAKPPLNLQLDFLCRKNTKMQVSRRWPAATSGYCKVWRHFRA